MGTRGRVWRVGKWVGVGAVAFGVLQFLVWDVSLSHLTVLDVGRHRVAAMRGMYSLTQRPPGAPERSFKALVRPFFMTATDIGLQRPYWDTTAWNTPVLFLPIWVVSCAAVGAGCVLWFVASVFDARRTRRSFRASGIVFVTAVVLVAACVVWRASRLEMRAWGLPQVGSVTPVVTLCRKCLWVDFYRPTLANTSTIVEWPWDQKFHSAQAYQSLKTMGYRIQTDPYIRIPTMWFVAVALVPFTWAAWRRWKRPGRGYCRECGYDLHKNESGVCPECGTHLEQSAGTGKPVETG